MKRCPRVKCKISMMRVVVTVNPLRRKRNYKERNTPRKKTLIKIKADILLQKQRTRTFLKLKLIFHQMKYKN